MDIVSNNNGHARVAVAIDIYANITSRFMEETTQKIENQLVGIINPRPIMTKSEEDFRSLAAKIRLNLAPN